MLRLELSIFLDPQVINEVEFLNKVENLITALIQYSGASKPAGIRDFGFEGMNRITTNEGYYYEINCFLDLITRR